MVAETSKHLEFDRKLLFNNIKANVRLLFFEEVDFFVRLDKEARIILPFFNTTIDQANFPLVI